MNPSSLLQMQGTPASLGYRMPAEWAPQEAVWLVWPKNTITWPDSMLERVEQAFLSEIRALLPGQKVRLLVDDVNASDRIRFALKGTEAFCNLDLREAPTEDSWIRDFGPTFLKKSDGSRAWCKWIFNAWGGKYEDLMRDNEVFRNPALIADPAFDTGFILEGGSIEVNGEGTCLTSEQCLLNPNRNPSMSKVQIEQKLRDYLGVSQILWLKEGIVGDDTDGHIDDIARFTDAGTIVAAFETNQKDPNYTILQENWERLEGMRTPSRGRWNLVKLPMPAPIMAEGEPLPASYANFYIGNQVVLVPVFDDDNDFKALGILKELFTGRKIIPVDAREMVYGLGTVHCLSQQEPL